MSNKDKINKQIEVQRKYKSQLDNVVNKVPYLKKIKDNAEGLTHRGDIISDSVDKKSRRREAKVPH